jgi:hypothetical protein
MTHEELLAKLWILPANVTELQHGAKAVQALRAVVELHPQDFGTPGEPVICDYCKVDYPCPTIQAIEKELGNGLE